MIHICSLGGLHAVAASLDDFDLLTLLSPTHGAVDWSGLSPNRHLHVSFHDIVEPAPALVAPDANAMRQVLAFGDAARGRPLLVHCWAGISRSSAAAYAIACAHNPGFEREIAMELRHRAPEATPNRLMVALADDLLGCNGVMVDAVASIGRGAEAFEGKPYQLPLLWPQTPSSSQPKRSAFRLG
ncbi:tyrosine phosphatase family protein [Rhodopseudomonas sp. RCAM05734]|uniref:tyrosine phosphatase family protein n=1 Tax=Rhodopseudomonas sp. RCAM05734 TaxID=3457549 RepID=UPI004043FA38